MIKLYKYTLNQYFINLFIETANHIINTTNIKLDITDYITGEKTHGWSSTKYSYKFYGNNKYPNEFNCHTALICWRLLEFYNLVNNYNLFEYKKISKTYLESCKLAMEILDDDYVETPGRGGYFKNKFHKIRFPDSEEPLNYVFITGLCCLEYFRATKDIKYKNYFIKTCEYFKYFINNPNQKAIIYNDCLTWDYMPMISKEVYYDGTYKIKASKPEDLSHGSFAVDMIYAGYIENIIFTQEDLIKLSNTFVKHIWNNGKINWYIDGTNELNLLNKYRVNIISKYLPLTKYNKNIYNIISNFYNSENIIGSKKIYEDIKNSSYYLGAYSILPYANLLYYKE